MSDFDSLTIALEDWFDRLLSEMPDSIRQRIEKDMFPLPWDDLSQEQRRIGALQLDYQHDPATENERQYWWDFYLRKDALKKQISEWEKAATPTASNLAHKEARLKELRNELGRMDQQERQPQRPYFSGRAQSAPSTALAPATANYIAYPKAMKALAERLNATPEELAAWIFYGPDQGGIAAYTNANEFDPPRRFFYGYYTGSDNYIAPLMACWFSDEDIASFQPGERFITGKALIERWGRLPGIQPAAFIRAKIAESRLADMHPTFGVTEVSSFGTGEFPQLEAGLFAMSEITTVEGEDGIIPAINHLSRKESPEERKRRIQSRVAQLKTQGVRNFLETVAKEEAISPSRIKQIVYDKPKSPSSTVKGPDNPWSGLKASRRQTSQKKLKPK